MRSIYFRVVIITVYTITISSSVGFYIANAYYHGVLKPYNDAKLFKAADMIRNFIGKNPDMMGDYLHHTAALGYQLYVHDEQGNDYFYGGSFHKLDLPSSVRESVLAGNEYHGIAEYPNNPLIINYFDNLLSNTVGIHVSAGSERFAMFLRHDTRVQFDELETFFGLMFVFTALFSIPCFLISTRYLVQPITRLTEATKRIAQGDFNLRLPTSRKDEIGQLAKHFEKMAFQLEHSDRLKKEFVANVSHEIHSPLTSIQGFADSLLRDDLDREQIQHYATIIGQETRQLATLSKQLLLLSTLDNGKEAIEKKPYLLQPQVRQALQLLEWQLAEKEIAVRMRIPARLHILGDEVLLMQVWSNLLSNAVKYIPKERSIDIEAFREEDGCVFVISDTGDGIPEEQLPFLFDRFYKGDMARQRGDGSVGLGLSIVQKIVHFHGGIIEVDSNEDSGTVFRVRIPD
ncbi:sensor histidine kinase [Paenibacillus agilis]|uniref:Heme sensor protein HssS n=1 Tax=Paenibacillus agilis TaxID=3020863 RepID=A0A559IK91_9BACL|nr:HAMP domain-containing sensor histidine kinase [Paenibacillus agilis]TVX88078.1 HAMP domain-containing histidine kinase [Paenibacillus agilis]